MSTFNHFLESLLGDLASPDFSSEGLQYNQSAADGQPDFAVSER